MTVYRLKNMEHDKRIRLINELRRTKTPYTIEYNKASEEYLIKVKDYMFYAK